MKQKSHAPENGEDLSVVNADKYFYPLAPRAFRNLFGMEKNKEIVMQFLNDVLKGQHHIVDVMQQNYEHKNIPIRFRKEVIELGCMDDQGQQLIVLIDLIRLYNEVIDRADHHCTDVTYANPPLAISDGKNSRFEFKKVIYIGIAEKRLSELKSQHYLTEYTCANPAFVWFRYPKTWTLFFLDVSRFNKKKNIQPGLEQWMYLLKNMQNLKEIPEFLQTPVFQKALEAGNVSKLDRVEKKEYENRLRYGSKKEEEKLMAVIEAWLLGEEPTDNY